MIERKHCIKKHCIKIHFAININTKEIIDMQITRDNIADSKAALDIMKDKNDKIDKLYADGAYDTLSIYKLLEDNEIEAIIKPRRNARDDSISNIRNENVRCIKELGYKELSKLKGYNKRWTVETVYSSFKRMFNEYCLARSFEYIKKEIITKVWIYNMLINIR